MRDISNRTLSTHEVFSSGIFQMLVQDAVKPASFVLVPVDAILDLLWSIASKVIRLTLHGPNTSIHEKQPIRDLRNSKHTLHKTLPR